MTLAGLQTEYPFTLPKGYVDDEGTLLAAPADTPAPADTQAPEPTAATEATTLRIYLLDYTPGTAAHHGRLLAYVRKSGTPRGAHDLIIAAHAAETGRTVVSAVRCRELIIIH